MGSMYDESDRAVTPKPDGRNGTPQVKPIPLVGDSRIMKIQEHPNTLLVRQAWLAVAHGDIETLQEFWAEDIVWHATARSPWQGDKHGIASVFEYLAQIGEHEGSTDIALVSVMANDTYGALIVRVAAKQDTGVAELDTMLLCRFVDRRIQEVWTMSMDPTAVEEFWDR